jgi:hypothetical protein
MIAPTIGLNTNELIAARADRVVFLKQTTQLTTSWLGY